MYFHKGNNVSLHSKAQRNCRLVLLLLVLGMLDELVVLVVLIVLEELVVIVGGIFEGHMTIHQTTPNPNLFRI